MGRKFKKNKLIYIYIASVLVLCAVIYILPRISDSMNISQLVEYETLEISQETGVWVFRNENVYISEKSGKTDYSIAEGIKVRKKAKVMTVEGEKEGEAKDKYTKIVEKLGETAVKTSEYRAGINGIVSYYIDGNEGVFSASNLKNIKHSDVKNIQSNDFESLKRKSVNSGEPVYKVYDNSKWYMVFWADKKESKKFKKGSSVTVDFEDAEISAVVSSKKKQGTSYRIILSSDRYYENLPKTRYEEVKLVTSRYSGLAVDNSCIVDEGEKKAVYVKDKIGDYNKIYIEVLFSDDDESIIKSVEEDELKLYDEVLKNP